MKPLRRPSLGDLITLSQIMSDPDYDFSIFAMLLAVTVRKRKPRTELHGFITTDEEVVEVMIEDKDSAVGSITEVR